MEIEQIDMGKKGFFEALVGQEQAGKITYTWAGQSKFIIDHTEVDPRFKGKGVGKGMLKAAVDFARKNRLKVIPLCPFAKSVMEKTPEFREVLA